MNKINILWALKSPCNLNCQYCYFGTQEESLSRLSNDPSGILTHSPHRDADNHSIFRFISEFNRNYSYRVFIAGGEPLRFPVILEIIAQLKAKGCEVIICTNGIPLESSDLCQALLHLKVDAISVSLDSHISEVNDSVRNDPTNKGCSSVIVGIRNLLKEKQSVKSAMRVGIYSVLTRANAHAFPDFHQFISSLNINYWVFQPVSLDATHKLHPTHSLREIDFTTIKPFLENICASDSRFVLPRVEYIDLIDTAIKGAAHVVKNCFAGRDLFFIQPDGTIWDCPSALKIKKDRMGPILSITNNSAERIFSTDRRTRCTDCSLLSVDCVNMWPLMDFDRILTHESTT